MKQHHFEESVIIGKAKLQVAMDLGSVTVRSHQADTIIIDGETAGMEVSMSHENHTVYLDVMSDEYANGWLNWVLGQKSDKSKSSEQPSATFTITVPTDCQVKVKNSAGQVAISEVAGDVKVNVTAGEVILRELGGQVDAQAVTGRVSYGGYLAEENHRFDVTTGEISVKLNKTPQAEIDLRTVVGSAVCRFPFVDEAKRQEWVLGRRVRGTVGTGTGRIRARVVTGFISVHPVGSKAEEKAPLKADLQGDVV